MMLFLGVSLLALVPFSHLALARRPEGRPPAKVAICHISDVAARAVLDADGEPVLDDDGNPVTEEVFLGEVIRVAAPAVAAHCAHGDHTSGLEELAVGDACERLVGSDATCGDDETAAVDPPWYPLGEEEEEEEEEEE
jgi:hypothetical protein